MPLPLRFLLMRCCNAMHSSPSSSGITNVALVMMLMPAFCGRPYRCSSEALDVVIARIQSELANDIITLIHSNKTNPFTLFVNAILPCHVYRVCWMHCIEIGHDHY